MKKLKPDIINGPDGELMVEYDKINRGGRTFVVVGLRGNYAKPVIDAFKRVPGSFENHFDRYYASKSHAQEVLLPTIKSVMETVSEGMQREERIFELIETINATAKPGNEIKDVKFAKRLMMERMTDEQLLDKIWNHLSTNKRSGELFAEQRTDPTLPIVFVDISFLRSRRYNKIFQDASEGGIGKSVNKVKETIKEGKKLSSVPIYDLKDKKVVEGNHRVEALYQLGFKTVPVEITGGWD